MGLPNHLSHCFLNREHGAPPFCPRSKGTVVGRSIHHNRYEPIVCWTSRTYKTARRHALSPLSSPFSLFYPFFLFASFLFHTTSLEPGAPLFSSFATHISEILEGALSLNISGITWLSNL